MIPLARTCLLSHVTPKSITMPSEDSYRLIEGDWKDFRFRRITPSDYPAVFDQIAQNYVRDEAVEKLLGWSQEMADEVTRVVEHFLPDGLSFLAEHRDSGKVSLMSH